MCRKSFFLFSIIFITAVVLVNFAQADLIGYWKFDEATGTVAADSAGGDNDGTLIGDGLEWTAGRSGGGLFFPGDPTDARVEFPTTGMSATSGTVAMWGLLTDPQPETDGRYFFGHTTQPQFSNRIQIYMQEGTTPSRLLDIGLGDAHALDTDIMEIPLEEWIHIALTWDSGNYFVYVNGEEVSNGTYTGLSVLETFANIGNDGSSGPYEAFGGLLDEVKVYNNALSPVEILSIMKGKPFPLASGPNPKEGTLLLDTWANLSWRAGEFAVSHDVYIGDNFDEVNSGAENTFQGNQKDLFIVAGFPGFPVPNGLVPGKTYYWRIDEVNDAEPNSPWKGDIWSFSIAPKTAYEPIPADDAESIPLDIVLNWTEGFGAKLHTVYFGDNFDDVENATGGQAQGVGTYTPGPLKKAKTYYWRVDEFDITETHKGEVWSFTTEGAVTALNPVNGAIDVSQTPVLTWAPGQGASHEVYFGSDPASLELKASGNLGSESFEPGQLEWNSTYYWRVDEANNTNAESPWTGPLWRFNTANFLIIDDMESYNDLDEADPGSNRIYLAWVDGYDNPALNGSVIGHANAPFAEQTIVHSGGQSMPMTYDNAVGKSEATLTLTSNHDWTINGVDTLTIWYRGSAGNAAETMYVTLNGSATVDNVDPDAATKNSWTEWNTALQAFADQGVNLTNVTSITIGLRSVTGGSGMLYFDDVRLYPPTSMDPTKAP